MKTTVVLLLLLSTVGCYTNSGPNLPALDAIHYPTSVLTVPDGSFTLVTNTVLDRRYDRGHLTVLDPANRRVNTSGILTGLFAGGMAISDTVSEAGEHFLVLPTRDEDLLELYGISFENDVTLRVLNVYNDFGVKPMTGAPLSVVSVGDGFMVSHPKSSLISFWGLDTEAGTLTYGCSTSIGGGVHMLAKHPVTSQVYVTSRLSPSVSVVELESAGWFGDPSTRSCRIQIRDTFNVGSRNSHGIVFNDRGTRLYISSLADGDVRMFDVSLDASGAPLNMHIGSSWVGEGGGLLRFDPLSKDVFIAVTDDRQIVRLNGGNLNVEQRLLVSGQPYDLDFAVGTDASTLLVVSYFSEHKVGLIELTPNGLIETNVLESSQ